MSSRENTKPAPLWVVVLAFVAVLEGALTASGGYAVNCVVAVCGLLGTPILLGLFRMKEAQLSAGGRYSDWRFRARHLAVVLTSFGWFIGLLNVFFVAVILRHDIAQRRGGFVPLNIGCQRFEDRFKVQFILDPGKFQTHY